MNRISSRYQSARRLIQQWHREPLIEWTSLADEVIRHFAIVVGTRLHSTPGRRFCVLAPGTHRRLEHSERVILWSLVRFAIEQRGRRANCTLIQIGLRAIRLTAPVPPGVSSEVAA